MTDLGDTPSIERQTWTYKQLLRVEAHWTAQVQNQQTRIATTLSVNGIMLAFIAGSGFLAVAHLSGAARALLVASVAALALAVACGLKALWPRTDPEVVPFISSKWLIANGTTLPEKELFAQLNESVTESDGMEKSITYRRVWLRRQLFFIGLSLPLLMFLAPAAVYNWR